MAKNSPLERRSGEDRRKDDRRDGDDQRVIAILEDKDRRVDSRRKEDSDQRSGERRGKQG